MDWAYADKAKKCIAYALMGICVGISLPSLAQETQSPVIDAPQLRANQVQPSVPTPTEPEIKAVRFDDWYFRCVDTKNADGTTVPSCEVAQLSQIKQNDQDVNILTLAIARTAPSTAAKGNKEGPELLLTALVPLNVFLPAAFIVTADGNLVTRIEYRNCNQAGCWAQHNLDAKMLASLQKAAGGVGSLRLMNGQNVNIKFSLKGLSAALNELQKSVSN